MDPLFAPPNGRDKGRCDVVKVIEVGVGDCMWHFDKDCSAPPDVIFVKGEAGGRAPSNGIPIFGRLCLDIFEISFRCVRLLDRDDESVACNGGHQVLGE